MKTRMCVVKHYSMANSAYFFPKLVPYFNLKTQKSQRRVQLVLSHETSQLWFLI